MPQTFDEKYLMFPPLLVALLALAIKCNMLSAQEIEPLIPLESPTDAVLGGASWAVRVDIDPSFETPLTFLVSGTETASRISVYRFAKRPRTRGNVDLDYVQKVAVPLDAPEWLWDLEERAGGSGLDGMTVSMQFADHRGSHEVTRWSPGVDTEERNLVEFWSFAKRLMAMTGIRPRKLLLLHEVERWSDDIVEISIPVSPAFVRAAHRIERLHEVPVGKLLERMGLGSGGSAKEEELQLNSQERSISGKIRLGASLALTELLGKWTFASEEHMFETLSRVATSSDPFHDPLAKTKSAQVQD